MVGYQLIGWYFVICHISNDVTYDSTWTATPTNNTRSGQKFNPGKHPKMQGTKGLLVYIPECMESHERD